MPETREITPDLDFRTDAITRPTPAMWDAMRQAVVGWAPVGDDPTVRRLETTVAELCGKEAALFLPTATMANLVAIMIHAKHGDQVIVEADSHIYWSEEWGAPSICGVLLRPVRGERGVLSAEDIETAITDSRSGHTPVTSLLCVEDSHTGAGGAALTPAEIDMMAAVAHAHGAAVHLDGARLANAAVRLGASFADLTRACDSVTISLNKGLSAPYGAVLCGTRKALERARTQIRKIGGASIHQAGLLAAAALVALETMMGRLADDHARAQQLASLLATVSGLTVVDRVDTNIVLARIANGHCSAPELCVVLREGGIGAFPYTPRVVRLVTHRHVTDASVELLASAIEEALSSPATDVANETGFIGQASGVDEPTGDSRVTSSRPRVAAEQGEDSPPDLRRVLERQLVDLEALRRLPAGGLEPATSFDPDT